MRAHFFKNETNQNNTKKYNDYDRLSYICLLAVEHDIDVNVEQLIDKFSDIHKNSRIMLK